MQLLVLTVMGPDRPGLVDSLSRVIAAHGASWQQSRMARLAGQFAGILLVQVPVEAKIALVQDLEALGSSALMVHVASGEDEERAEATRSVSLSLVGSDRPGIVQRISRALAEHGVNVDAFESEVSRAPISSELLFTATATLSLPAGLELSVVRRDLEALAGDMMVDLTLDEG